MRTDQLRILSLTTFFENNKLTSEQIGARSINLTSKQIGARSISINFWTNRRTQKEAICNFRRSSRCPAHENPEKSWKNQDRFLQSRFFWIRRKSRLKEAILIFDAILGDFLDAQPTKILLTAHLTPACTHKKSGKKLCLAVRGISKLRQYCYTSKRAATTGKRTRSRYIKVTSILLHLLHLEACRGPLRTTWVMNKNNNSCCYSC